MVNLKGLMMILELHLQGLAVLKYRPKAARACALDDFRGYLSHHCSATKAALSIVFTNAESGRVRGIQVTTIPWKYSITETYPAGIWNSVISVSHF